MTIQTGVTPFWGIGMALVALMAWLFPQWRSYHLVTAIPLLLILILPFISPPDSLPWLMSNDRHKEAKE